MKGVNRLCFSCGRIGHRRDGCPHVIHSPPTVDKDAEVQEEGQVSNSRMACDPVDPIQGEAVRDAEQKDTYGPWVMVTRKRQSNRGIKNQQAGSGTGYLRISNGNSFLHVGPRGSYMKDNRSTPDKPQSVSVAQVPNESLTNLGSPLSPDLLAGAAHEGPFSVGSISSQAQGGSVKGKKDLARSRAHITSSSVAAESRSFPKPTPITTVSKSVIEVILASCLRHQLVMSWVSLVMLEVVPTVTQPMIRSYWKVLFIPATENAVMGLLPEMISLQGSFLMLVIQRSLAWQAFPLILP